MKKPSKILTYMGVLLMYSLIIGIMYAKEGFEFAALFLLVVIAGLLTVNTK